MICAACRKELPTDEESDRLAAEEELAVFGKVVPEHDKVAVCDECYVLIAMC